MTVSLVGDQVSDCDTAADFTTINGGANINATDDDFVEGTGAVGDKMSNTTEVLASDTLAGGAAGVYDFSSGGNDEGKHFIGWVNVKTPFDATDGIATYFRNASGHLGTWNNLGQGFYKGGFALRLQDPERDFDAATTWTTAGNPAQLDDVSIMGFQFHTVSSIMGSFNNTQVDAFTVGFGMRAASNRFTFGSTSGVSSANDTITATAHGWAHGTPVYYDKEGGTQNIGLTDATIYYINADGVNTVTLHATRAQAIADTSPINLTAGGAETHSITPAYGFEDVKVEDEDTNFYGWWTQVNGVYTGRGKLYIGPASGNAESRFTELSNSVVFADELAGVGFYEIDIAGTDTLVDWTLVNIAAGNPANARWSLTMAATAGNSTGFGLNALNCTFSGTDVITLNANATLTNCVLPDGTSMVQTGATIDGCSFLDPNVSTSTAYMTVSDIEVITDCVFESSAAGGHAIELRPTGAGPFDIDISGCQFSGYAASDGSTGDEAILIHPVTNGADITLNVIGGGSTPSIMEHADYTGTFSLVVAPVTLTIKCVDATTGVDLQNVRVLVCASDATGPFDYEEAVTIASSGTTATVTKTAHGYSSGDKVQIRGATESVFNTAASITVTGANTFTYTMSGTNGGSPATGSPTCTQCVVYGLTDVNGEIAGTYALATDQPVEGNCRKHTASPLYKTGRILAGTNYDSAVNTNLTIPMIIDE